MKKTPFCATSEQDQLAMFETLGIADFDDLFSAIPADLRSDEMDIPLGLSEMEMMQHIRKIARKNSTNLVNFCGAGFYDHYIPAAVNALSSRGEFYTAYTPYQPEASQGTLQAAFEYQTAICRLTEMEVANASLFDGGTALFEGIMMALRHTGRNKVLVDEGVSPIYRKMLRCYTQNLSVNYQEVKLSGGGIADRAAYQAALDETVGAVVFQNPNFFGCLDNLSELIEQVHAIKALAIMSVYPQALSHVETPGAMGADIVTGEGQSLGLSLNFGGPYLGFMATTKKLVRKMPGRIVGETTDAEGRRGYVLTLQAREQHIRREKATSNICSNVQLCALRAIIYLSLVGREGFLEVGRDCMDRASYAWHKITKIPGVEPAFNRRFFNEFAVRLPRDAAEVVSALVDQGIAAGFPVGRYYEGMENILLLAFTEKRTKEEIDILVAKLESAMKV
ncbi:MAG: aminomethyl-transferring glycine dehydrogenase subunit GcvPA [Pontiellaceae bacterium]|nr:aminomethyl-transferring glycine dehydrogenase subunit GcvPA [Pontiellaceae bacterium]MBN2783413.1 aminomethyl-transferring glycine dehydrogenase subunit GcvPA [Pontiellaceae bacterium]